MNSTETLEMGVDTFLFLDLLRKAAGNKGLKLRDGDSRALSEPIKVYNLDKRLLAFLAERGIRGHDRPDCHYDTFTLVDENPQKAVPGYCPSNYWNFKSTEGEEHAFDLQISLSVGLNVSIEKRGIVLLPQSHGTFLSPADQLPNFRMFRALVESDDDTSTVAKELAASEGSIVITWTDLGLGGIRKLSDLFAEFACQKKAIMRLAGSGEILCPVPNPQYQQPGDELFVAEPAQPRVFEMWRTQLSDYSASLAA